MNLEVRSFPNSCLGTVASKRRFVLYRLTGECETGVSGHGVPKQEFGNEEIPVTLLKTK